MSCFTSKQSKADYCLLLMFYPVTDTSGRVLCNEFDCPLFLLSKKITILTPQKIDRAVSFVHHCNATCHFRATQVNQSVERETIPVSRNCFIHDLTNRCYCLNVFCIV